MCCCGCVGGAAKGTYAEKTFGPEKNSSNGLNWNWKVRERQAAAAAGDEFRESQ